MPDDDVNNGGDVDDDDVLLNYGTVWTKKKKGKIKIKVEEMRENKKKTLII